MEMEKNISTVTSLNVKVTREHKCEICEKEFTTKQKQKKHFATVHDKNVKVFKTKEKNTVVHNLHLNV